MFPTTSQCPMHNKPLLRFDSSDYLCLVGVVNGSCKQQAETFLLQFWASRMWFLRCAKKFIILKSSDSQIIHFVFQTKAKIIRLFIYMYIYLYWIGFVSLLTDSSAHICFDFVARLSTHSMNNSHENWWSIDVTSFKKKKKI